MKRSILLLVFFASYLSSMYAQVSPSKHEEFTQENVDIIYDTYQNVAAINYGQIKDSCSILTKKGTVEKFLVFSRYIYKDSLPEVGPRIPLVIQDVHLLCVDTLIVESETHKLLNGQIENKTNYYAVGNNIITRRYCRRLRNSQMGEELKRNQPYSKRRGLKISQAFYNHIKSNWPYQLGFAKRNKTTEEVDDDWFYFE